MARKAKADATTRRPGETYFEFTARKAREKQNERDRNEPLVTPEAEHHGHYVSELVVDPETGAQGASRTLVNRGGDPYARWKRAGAMTESQIAACDWMLRQWSIAGHHAAVTTHYGERLPGSCNTQEQALRVMEAADAIARVRSMFHPRYYSVFENVIRFGIAAGSAGAALNQSSRTAQHTAYVVVCFVADHIAMKEGL